MAETKATRRALDKARELTHERAHVSGTRQLPRWIEPARDAFVDLGRRQRLVVGELREHLGDATLESIRRLNLSSGVSQGRERVRRDLCFALEQLTYRAKSINNAIAPLLAD
ncbi:MAG: hypothetical protein ABSD78_19890 [Acidimicrobiales bacterium]|jgi:hypothetical protein